MIHQWQRRQKTEHNDEEISGMISSTNAKSAWMGMSMQKLMDKMIGWLKNVFWLMEHGCSLSIHQLYKQNNG